VQASDRHSSKFRKSTVYKSEIVNNELKRKDGESSHIYGTFPEFAWRDCGK
jgi:hypothetical protein